GQVRNDEVGKAHGTLPSGGFWRAEGVATIRQFGEAASDADNARGQVDVIAPQRGQLAPSQTGEHGPQDKRTGPGGDGVGQREYLVDREHWPFRRFLLSGTFDAAWVAADNPVVHGGAHYGFKQPVRFGGGHRVRSGVHEALVPAADVGRGDVSNGSGPEP